MKRLALAAVLLAGTAFASLPAKAEVIDPLHIQCSSCTADTIGGNDIHTMTSVTNFWFSASPDSLSGDLQLKVLITNNFTIQQVTAFAAAVDVTSSTGGTFDLVLRNGGNLFTQASGGLDTFLGVNASPNNPADAFTGASSAIRGTTIDGYYVLTADLGAYSAPKDGGIVSPSAIFSLDPSLFCDGCLLAANLFTTTTGVVATANSSFGIFNGPDSGPFCTVEPCTTAVPGPIVGAGIPGLIAACGGLFGMNFWRRRRNGSHLPA